MISLNFGNNISLIELNYYYRIYIYFFINLRIIINWNSILKNQNYTQIKFRIKICIQLFKCIIIQLWNFKSILSTITKIHLLFFILFLRYVIYI